MRIISQEQFRAEMKAQGVTSREHIAFRCPICGTVQSAHSLIAAGAGKAFEDVETSVGFNCVGRYTGRPGHTKRDAPGLGCNWTLGGLFRLHELEVDSDGVKHPFFELATPEEAQALQAMHFAQVAP